VFLSGFICVYLCLLCVCAAVYVSCFGAVLWTRCQEWKCILVIGWKVGPRGSGALCWLVCFPFGKVISIGCGSERHIQGQVSRRDPAVPYAYARSLCYIGFGTLSRLSDYFPGLLRQITDELPNHLLKSCWVISSGGASLDYPEDTCQPKNNVNCFTNSLGMCLSMALGMFLSPGPRQFLGSYGPMWLTGCSPSA